MGKRDFVGFELKMDFLAVSSTMFYIKTQFTNEQNAATIERMFLHDYSIIDCDI